MSMRRQVFSPGTHCGVPGRRGGRSRLILPPARPCASRRQPAEVERPVILVGALTDLPALLATRGDQEVRFDAVVGRNTLTKCADKTGALAQMRVCLRPGGRLSLAEVVPRHAQRLSALADLTELDSDLVARLRAAEEMMYQAPTDALVNWDVPDLEAALVAVGFTLISALQYAIPR